MAPLKTPFKTPLGRVRGKGSARDGTNSFWRQRLTAIALIPLAIMFVSFMAALTGASHAAAASAMGSPFIGVLILMFILVGFYHLQIGVTHIIEDYVQWDLGKFGLIIAVNLGCLGLGLTCILSVLKLSFGSAS